MLRDLELGAVYDGFLFLAESARNPPSLRSYHHRELELNLVVRGTITYVSGGGRFAFGPRSLLWIFPTQEHQLVDRSNDSRYYVAVFKPELVARCCRSAKYSGLKRNQGQGDRILHTILDPETFGFLRQVMDRMMEGTLDEGAGLGRGPAFRCRHSDPEGLNAGLHHLLMFAWRLQQAGTNTHHPVSLHPSVIKAMEILNGGGWNGSLAQLARRCGVSGTHFSRIFARQTGVPLSRYRNSLRLERFWEQYHQPVRRTMLEAVYAAGFGSYAQFYKVFADVYGQGPRACLKVASSPGGETGVRVDRKKHRT